ncbi:MAG TPA: hypothetical protein PK156_37185 [Polyangium sp.]|nr:hypothetical protein [Polyangium sp.]
MGVVCGLVLNLFMVGVGVTGDGEDLSGAIEEGRDRARLASLTNHIEGLARWPALANLNLLANDKRESIYYGDELALFQEQAVEGVAEVERPEMAHYGLERLCDEVVANHAKTAQDIKEAIFADVMAQFDHLGLRVACGALRPKPHMGRTKFTMTLQCWSSRGYDA